MAFYYEQKSVLGTWSPVKSADEPQKRNSEGRLLNIRNIHELTGDLEMASLDELYDHFNPPEVAAA